MRDDYGIDHYGNDAYARAEAMRLMYPPKPSTRSSQFAAFIAEAAETWPESVAAAMWVGCVYRWLDRPLHNEVDLVAAAREELDRLNDERRGVWVV